MHLDDPAFLPALRAAIAHNDENNDARARLVPVFPDGNPARLSAPPPGVAPRRGAVLALLYPVADQLWLPLTLRSGALRNHTGEISLPGGAIDAGDESVAAAALREAREEVGLSAPVTVLGNLTDVYIAPSNFVITPVVGWLPAPPQLTPDPREVAAILHLPVGLLLDPDAVTVEERLLRGHAVRVPFYAFNEHKVWGATSIVLSQLAARLRPLLAPSSD